MLPVLACAYLKNSGLEAFDKFFSIYNSTYDPTEAKIFLKALGCMEHSESLKKFILNIIDFWV